MIQELPTSTPSLRFPFFKGKVWNKCLLQNIAAPVTDKANSSCTDPVLTLSCEYGLIIQKNYFEKNIHSSNLSRYIKVQNNDFVYNDRVTNLYPYGTIKRNTLNIKGLVSPIYKCFRFFTKTEPAFWQYYFEAHCHENELKNIINEGARTGRFNISIKQFLKISVFLPDKAEQKKIADCLSSLDELIEAHEQKLDALKQHKKGLMQHLFPVEGETTPRWRFPEFRNAGEWEKYEIGDIFTATRGQVLAMTELQAIKTKNFSYPVYSSQTKNNGLAGYYSDYLYENAITWTTDGANAGEVNFRKGKFYCTNVCGVLLNKDGYANKCISEIINFVSKKYVSYVGNPKLMNNAMKKIKITIPSLPEQQKIADCLTSLDERIEAQEEKIAALKEHKKGLMQKLFPSL